MSNGSGQARLMAFGAGPLRRAGLKKVFFIIITYYNNIVKYPLGSGSGLALHNPTGHIVWGRSGYLVLGKYSAHIGRWKEQKNRI